MTTALYRRYRPDTFADVIGQEHVTEPLVQALRADKVTHAYLFSGPRGCGKTTSARILARCLNCAQGPTPEPCGQCASCVELARGGPGSLDVVEIDAASHGGVDDARDLRERATFAPARDRYKVFILDEAHMVTSQGFNALLKIVEEPPEHVKFIFATTEPDKVIGTIRSRTHHYPFRLVGPATLLPYLEQICEAEGVPVGSGVLPLVVRAGGGSVRDSLSVLDQLVAGADDGGIDYERAVALLGYTHAALLDDAVDAIAARDGGSAFRVVDRVVSSGHEPRRFVEDLLERLRDLIVIAASGESAGAVLRELPADQLDRMRGQAAALGSAELSRSADLANTALTEMTGATSPRLHLELLVARLLLPAADDGTTGLAARLDRVERELGSSRSAAGTGSASAPAPAPAPASGAASSPAPPASPPAEPEPDADSRPPAPEPKTDTGRRAAAEEPETTAVDQAVPAAELAPPAAEPTAPAAEPAAATGGVEAETVRRRWPEVLDTLRGLRMATWVLVSQNAQVTQVTAEAVTLGFTTPQLAATFRNGTHAENVRRALHETLGLDARVETGLAAASDDRPASGTAPAAAATAEGDPEGEASVEESTRRAQASWDAPTARPASPAADPGPASGPSAPKGGVSAAQAAAETGADAPPQRAAPTAPTESGAGDRTTADRKPDPEATGDSSDGPAPRQNPPARTGEREARRSDDDGGDAAPDDPDLNASGLVGPPLVAQMLGGTVIDEIPDPPS